jgi:replication factor A1
MMSSPPAASYFPISELSSYQTKWTIKAKVVSKAPMRTFNRKANGAEGNVFHVELADGPSGEIRASFFNDAATKFHDILEVGKTYTFSRGQMKVANRQYNSCNHRYEITFERDAVIEPAAESVGTYEVQFKFCDLRAVQSKQLPCRVDLCGIVTQFKPFQTISTKDGRELNKRDITMADDTATSMEVTLWGEKGKLPDSDFEGWPVIGIKGVLIKEFNGGRSGSTIESATVVLRPAASEAQRVQRWWAEGGSSQALTSLRGAGGQGGAAARNAEHCSVSELRRKVERVGEQMEFYSFTGRLAIVQTRKQGEEVPLHYVACAEPKEGNGLPCNRRVDTSGHCAACNRAGKTNVRLNARCRFSDFADSVWLTTFHEAAVGVFGMSGEELAAVDISADGGRERLETIFRQRSFLEPLEITARAKLDTYQGEAKSNVTCIQVTPVNYGVRGRKMLADIQELFAVAA